MRERNQSHCVSQASASSAKLSTLATLTKRIPGRLLDAFGATLNAILAPSIGSLEKPSTFSSLATDSNSILSIIVSCNVAPSFESLALPCGFWSRMTAVPLTFALAFEVSRCHRDCPPRIVLLPPLTEAQLPDHIQLTFHTGAILNFDLDRHQVQGAFIELRAFIPPRSDPEFRS